MDVTVYKCFIASPGDTAKERELCDKVFKEINETLGQHLQFRVESKRWEKDARPSFGVDGQDVINGQLLNDYDMFIGIMWNRFGAPTQRAESGTEEEFDIAYKKHIEKQDVEIMMYFNDESTKASSLDFEQAKKVDDFKGKVSDLGGLYNVYDGSLDFEVKLKRHLNDYFVGLHAVKKPSTDGQAKPEELRVTALYAVVKSTLDDRLTDSLSLFINQPTIWIEPVLSKTNDIDKNADVNHKAKVDLESIINAPKSVIIKSPPQFGLTCLSHYLIAEAWGNNSTWVYLNAKSTRRDATKKAVLRELRSLNLEAAKPDCIVLDSWCSDDLGAKKLLRNLCHEFGDIPIIVMQTINDGAFKAEEKNEKVNRDFDVLHLLALPRAELRKVVSNYNDARDLGDENIVLDKVLKDFDVLNIHRTVLNCVTLLKVSEINFDESPANRTKMIEMILIVLFSMDEQSSYKIKPDLKDCEHVLGRFCEQLIKSNNFSFNRECFLEDLSRFCKDKLLKLDVSVVFDVLFANNIIMELNGEFVFRASYWIYYFAARRMYSNEPFRDYILEEENYLQYPEMIEFYAGIDRERNELIEMLTKDIAATWRDASKRTGLPDDFNPLGALSWNPSKESLISMQGDINEDVQKSKLPDEVKDKYADNGYDQLRPYSQNVNKILNDYSFTCLISKVKASCRALRNSDYVDPDLKRELLKEITYSWKQVSKVFFALAPLLAENGAVAYEGQHIVLEGDFGSEKNERISNIFRCNPMNVVQMFNDDLFSNKIGPLLFDGIDIIQDDLIKHLLVLLVINDMPSDWRDCVEEYITSLPKNSFYLFDVFNKLKVSYKYSFASDVELTEIRYLLKMGMAKHELGKMKPSLVDMKKISPSIIPKREA
jgi:hypothetical protein